jgi:peptide/nickel transport system substrate-binding protein
MDAHSRARVGHAKAAKDESQSAVVHCRPMRTRHLLVVFGALAVAAGCQLGRDQGGEGREGREGRDLRALVVARQADIVGLDPARLTDSETLEVTELIFEGLVRWRPGTMAVEPALAASWEISADGRRWVFHLRDGARFHDGSPVDAAAVVASFERVLSPGHPAYLPDASYWRGVLRDVARVVATEPRTVAIELHRPDGPLLAALAGFPIVAAAALPDVGARPIGSGPFAFERWQPGHQVVVRRFTGYWGAPPPLDRIVFKTVVDARQRLIGLESASVDLATTILPDEQSFVELHPDLVLHHVPGNAVTYLALNTARPPLDDVRVRRAINLAIDKDPIIRLAFHGRAEPADGPLPPRQWAYHAATARYVRDVPAARALIAAVAAEGKLPARPLRLYLPDQARPYLPEPELVGRILSASLAEIGLRVELVVQPAAATRASLQQGEHDLALWGWIGDDTGDPDEFLSVLFDAGNAVAGHAQNVAFFRDARVTALLAAARATADQPARAAAYAEAQERIGAAAPWVPLAHGEFIVAARAELRGVELSPTGHPSYARIRRADGADLAGGAPP